MPLFTKETAAIYGKAGAIARWAQPEPVATPTPLPERIADQELDYCKLRLSRVRAQLDRVDAMAAEETDPKRIREYADATSRLQEQERQLAGRPLPGTLKPNARQTAQRPAISATYPVAPTLHEAVNPAQPVDNQGKPNG